MNPINRPLFLVLLDFIVIVIAVCTLVVSMYSLGKLDRVRDQCVGYFTDLMEQKCTCSFMWGENSNSTLNQWVSEDYRRVMDNG